MPFFSETVAAHLAGSAVLTERLVRLDFASETVRLAETAAGVLATADGQVWKGTATLGRIGDIESPLGGTASQVQMTLSGVDPDLVEKAIAGPAEYKGRPVEIFRQFYTETWQPLDLPYSVFRGEMSLLKSSGRGSALRTFTLVVEGDWTARGFAPFAHLSDRDQKRLHPGDRGLEQVASMQGKSIKWPNYR